MGRRKSDNIGKGRPVTPSHTPMPGVDDDAIDAGVPNAERSPDGEATPEQGGKKNFERGISPSTDPDHLF